MITGEQLLEVFAAYNPQIWPMQYVAYLLGAAAVVLAIRRTAISERLIPAILAFFWLWVALLFWLPSVLQGFTPGYFFVAIFLIQGLVFIILTIRPRLQFKYKAGWYTWVGLAIILYALAGYPLVGALMGHTYPRMSPFGLTPCPLVTFTFGLFLLEKPKVPKGLMILPFLYTLTGFVWVSIGMVEDIGMILSGLVATGLILYRNSKVSQEHRGEQKQAAVNGGWSLDINDTNQPLKK